MNTNRTPVAKTLGFRRNTSSIIPCLELPHPILVGVEIEMERLMSAIDFPNLEQEMGDYWVIKDDGSLHEQNSKEFVLAFPLGGKDLLDALKVFERTFGEGGVASAEYGPDTSVHYHLDARDLSVRQIITFFYFYAILEKLLYKAFNKKYDRYFNSFCVPANEMEEVYKNMDTFLYIEEKLEQEDNIDTNDFSSLIVPLFSDRHRYAGFNMNALKKFGSIEIRFCEGTGDIERIIYQIRILTGILNYAKGIDKPIKELPGFISVKGVTSLIESITTSSEDAEELRIPGWVDLLYEGLSSSNKLFIQDWKGVGIPDGFFGENIGYTNYRKAIMENNMKKYSAAALRRKKVGE